MNEIFQPYVPSMSWDDYFMAMATQVGTKSKDRSTKVGCVIVGPNNEVRTTGYNGFPRGANDNIDARHQRPLKYKWIEHSERNALYNAARNGIKTDGCRLYIHHFPCTDCVRGLWQSGIVEIITRAPEPASIHYTEDFEISQEIIKDIGIKIRYHPNYAASGVLVQTTL